MKLGFAENLLAGTLILSVLQTAVAQPDLSRIRLDTVGYLPGQSKRASIATACTNFAVVRVSDGRRVFEGKATGPQRNPDTDEELYVADFSTMHESGSFRLIVPGVGESTEFRIAPDVYSESFSLVTRAMYLWRCGTAVSARWKGDTFAHGPCHTNDAWLDVVAGEHQRRPSTGGWHDAGDYNKYVVNAGITVGCMLRAWEDFGPAVRRVRLDLPEAGGELPEFLAEVKWETDWLLTMQFADGSVSHKVSTKRFGGFVMPERETEDRYFTPWSSAAAADFVAMLAQAARIFQPYNAEYAGRCLTAARKSYAFLAANPTNHNADLRGFSTGGYGTRDADDRLWAAAEVWETTGDSSALTDVETRLRQTNAGVAENFDWSDVGNLGVITYIRSQRPGRDESLLALARKNLLETADKIVETCSAHGYARPLGPRYYWGCNGGVARQALILETARFISPKPSYRETTLDALHHLFGRNYHGRSYVTGLGYRPPLRPHDRRSGGDSVEAPWPGYLVGGPHPRPANWRDDQADYRTNEIAINWNAALIYALAAALPPGNP